MRLITAHLAAAGLPTVVTYRANRLTEWYVRLRARIAYASLPNIVLGREALPEALFSRATPDNIAAAAGELLESAELQHRQVEAGKEFIHKLQGPLHSNLQPSERAAQIVIQCVAERSGC
uniref:lipid-A-disaccharide synthase n=1 Tax=Tetraselmis sp. GSL018 TaxID=582737 RepID=A0A061RYN6_9CHLO